MQKTCAMRESFSVAYHLNRVVLDSTQKGLYSCIFFAKRIDREIIE